VICNEKSPCISRTSDFDSLCSGSLFQRRHN
jgi:hypothetical protein